MARARGRLALARRRHRGRDRRRRALLPLLAGAPRDPEGGPVLAADRERGLHRRRGARGRVLQRAAQGGAVRPHPEAADPGVHRVRGLELLRPHGRRRRRHRPRGLQDGAEEGVRPGLGAGRLDAHPADREGGADLRRGLQEVDRPRRRRGHRPQDPRGDPRAQARGGADEGGDPLPLPEQRLPRAPQLRRAVGGRELLPQGRARPHPRGDVAHRRPARRRRASSRRSSTPRRRRSAAPTCSGGCSRRG